MICPHSVANQFTRIDEAFSCRVMGKINPFPAKLAKVCKRYGLFSAEMLIRIPKYALILIMVIARDHFNVVETKLQIGEVANLFTGRWGSYILSVNVGPVILNF